MQGPTSNVWLKVITHHYLQIMGILFLIFLILFLPQFSLHDCSNQQSSWFCSSTTSDNIPPEVLQRIAFYKKEFKLNSRDLLPSRIAYMKLLFEPTRSKPLISPQMLLSWMKKPIKVITKPLQIIPTATSAVVKGIQHLTSRLSRKPKPRAYNSSNVMTINDRLEHHFHQIPLSLSQRERISILYQELIESLSTELQRKAEVCQFPISPFTLYLYLASTQWGETYNGISFIDAVTLSIEWRYDVYQRFHLPHYSYRHSLPVSHPSPHTHHHHYHQDLIPFIQQGFTYLSPIPDQWNRPILYFKFQNAPMGKKDFDRVHSVASLNPHSFADSYQKYLIYMMDQAIEQSIRLQSGRFVVLFDCSGFTTHHIPSMSWLQQIILILQQHYPYRVDEMYLINTGLAVTMLWKMIQSIIPATVLSKVTMIANPIKESSPLKVNLLVQRLGAAAVEKAYGGDLEIRKQSSHVYNYYHHHHHHHHQS